MEYHILGFNGTDPRFLQTNYSYQQPFQTVVIESNEYNLTNLGIFISSLLLSLSGCFAVVASHLRSSRCKTINCCGASCVRENVEV